MPTLVVAGQSLTDNGTLVRRDLLWAAAQPGPLTPLLTRYLHWGDFERTEFERTLGLLKHHGVAQYELFFLLVLLPASKEDVARLADERTVTEADLRMAKMRARRFIKAYGGAWIEHGLTGRARKEA